MFIQILMCYLMMTKHVDDISDEMRLHKMKLDSSINTFANDGDYNGYNVNYIGYHLIS